MSTSNQVPSPSASNTTQTFRTACDEYRRLTGHDLNDHPFATELEECDDPDGALAVLRKQIETAIKYDKDDEKLLAYLNLIVDVLFTLSEEPWVGVRLVSLPLLHCLA